jgi:hypothetical protein
VGGPIAVSAAATSFGMDFNPTADLVRIVDDADDNLRVNPDTGVLAGTDTALNYAGGDPNNGTDPNVSAAAYTNSRPAAATTVLYDIDTALDVLVTQAPPATGALTTVGSLGVDLSNVTSFDIAPSTEALPNAPAYIATTRTGAIPSNQAELFAVNLASTTTGNVPGKVASLGTIGSGTSTVVAFSII